MLRKLRESQLKNDYLMKKFDDVSLRLTGFTNQIEQFKASDVLGVSKKNSLKMSSTSLGKSTMPNSLRLSSA